MRRIILMTLLLLLSKPSTGEIYRWVDAEGNVHFSDKKPGGKDVDTVDLEISEPAEPDDGELRRLALVREAQERFKETVKLTPGVEPPPFDRVGACRDARRNYGALQEVMPVYRAEDGNYRPQWQGDAYKGRRDYVADDDRESVEREVMAQIHTHCDDPDNFDAVVEVYDQWIADELCDVSLQRLQRAQAQSSRTPLSETERLRREYRESCGG